MPKILVADDNANIQKMVALSFEDRGVAVVSVGNGEAAVRRIPDLMPDLVLADIFMPVRNGYEVCEFVKKDERFSHVPVILLVGAFDPLDEKEARRVGADGVLKKPFVPPDPLIAMVMSALEKNPKVAAELAKAREAKEAPPPAVESIPEPPTSARAELKPLPDFPEPTPEEAALVYGFGTGRRTLDDAPVGVEMTSGPKTPVAESEEAAEEEFDGAATARDWRRNAMEIDIPPEAANQPAFVPPNESASSQFPSERDVPPRRVPFSEQVEDNVPLPTPISTEPAPPETPEFFSAPAADSDFFAVAEPGPTAEVSAAVPQPAPFEPETAPASEAELESGPTHWMDRLAQGSSDHPASDWMSLLSEQTARDTTFAAPKREQEDFSAPPAFVAEESGASDVPTGSDVNATSGPVTTDPEVGEDSFFADEAAPSTSWSSPVENVSQPSTEPTTDRIEATAAEPLPIVSSKSEEGFETDLEPELPIRHKDPELIEPPAVHVTPEPLLVEEESLSSHYGVVEHQAVEPAHSFFPPAPSPVEEPEAFDNAAGPAPSFEIETAPVERIPTGPPPNREALAQIPFLTPPADFQAEPQEQATADPGTVDAVVRKVLEKLEPRLHDLLSQGVLKPLVENLLQSELAKKEE
ncbi:MAG TPA: response regulator [Candidatus Acidoferrum sp.]|nr:response regulator [Candidatus Acidoferrum sp.]